jgi:hypothetical protein
VTRTCATHGTTLDAFGVCAECEAVVEAYIHDVALRMPRGQVTRYRGRVRVR